MYPNFRLVVRTVRPEEHFKYSIVIKLLLIFLSLVLVSKKSQRRFAESCFIEIYKNSIDKISNNNTNTNTI